MVAIHLGLLNLEDKCFDDSKTLAFVESEKNNTETV